MKVNKEDTLHSCYDCIALRKETESWEMSHIWWWECRVRPGMANLTSFPFTSTKCQYFIQSKPRVFLDFSKVK